MNSLDDLELELRKLPGVRAAGFDERDDVLFIQLHVGGERSEQPVPVSATRIAARHSDRPVAVEIVRWRTATTAPAAPTNGGAATVDLTSATEGAEGGEGELTSEDANAKRPRLLAVLAFPDTDELEVHLILAGRRTIGRAAASRGLVGAVEATIDAVRGLGAAIDPRARWARALDDTGDERVLVAVALDHNEEDAVVQYGLAAGASPIDAAARSTLDALNRRLSLVL
ncbi:MAG: hypothetical protein ACT4OX_09740 [Actinomycetota bacterium]